MSSITRIRTHSNVPTREQSLALVRNLLRTSISSIVYLRNIFPEYCFRDRTLTGINVKALIPEIEDAKLLIAWLEKGVFDALEKKYLQSIIFGIYTDPNKATELVESYNFTISYDNNGHSIDIEGSGQESKFSTPTKITKDQIKQSTQTMLRHLTILSQTLEPLPSDRYLTLKLLYHPHTPESYEPPFFTHANPDDPLRFNLKPTKIKVGTVVTPFHYMSLKVKTTSGIFDTDTEGSAISSYEAENDSQPMWESDDEKQKEKEKEDLYPLIRSVVIKKKCYNLNSLAKEFPHISPTSLQGYLKKLKKDGIISKTNTIIEESENNTSTLIDELVNLLEDVLTVSITSISKLMNVDRKTARNLMKQLESRGIVDKGNQKIKKIKKQPKSKIGLIGKRKRATIDRPSKKQKHFHEDEDEDDEEEEESIPTRKSSRKTRSKYRSKCSIVKDPILQEMCEE